MVRRLPGTGDYNPLPHACGPLFQQYVCDVYSRVEAARLQWCRVNQDTLRADTYQGLFDAVQSVPADAAVPRTGQAVILPSSFSGSPRNMNQNYLDAMSLMRHYGKPDFSPR